MKPTIPDAGQKFGMLSFLGDGGPGPGRNRLWRMVCECGTEKSLRSDGVKQGKVQSCGCLHRRLSSERAMLDIAGHRYGRLRVLSLAGVSKTCGSKWACLCDCGAEKVVTAQALQRGATISCGCARLDQPGLTSAKFRAKNSAQTQTYRARKASAPGRFTPAQVLDLFNKQRGCCAWCGVKLGDGFHRDHRQALANGGSNEISNIELLCQPCNVRKSAKDEIDWANENGRLL